MPGSYCTSENRDGLQGNVFEQDKAGESELRRPNADRNFTCPTRACPALFRMQSSTPCQQIAEHEKINQSIV